VSDGLHVVHVRVVDAATNRPTPVRVRFQDRSGRRYVPLGHVAKFPIGDCEDVGLQVRLGDHEYSYIDGSCEILLPADPVEVEIVKGLEYVPIEREVTLGPGKMALRFAIERRQNLPTRGWFAADARCHELSPHAALLEGAAEGLALVNLLARERRSRFAEKDNQLSLLEAFSGQAACLASDESTVVVNTFNAHPALGKLSLLNCHRPVFPLTAGGQGFEDWTLGDWCGQCHRKRGLVIWSEPLFWSDAFLDFTAPEGLAQLLTGQVDAVELAGPINLLKSDPWANWYALLNAGFRIPLAGASGKASNRALVGHARTYAQLGREPWSYAAWIEAVRAGKTCVSEGPFIDFEVDGQPPGSTLGALTSEQPVQIRAEFGPHPDMGALEIVADGYVRVQQVSNSGSAISIAAELPTTGVRWMAARYRHNDKTFGAHTSPIYFHNRDRIPAPADSRIRALQEMLLRGLGWASTKAPFRLERNREGLVSTLHQATGELEKRLR
jgi:hypothetical protein